MPFGAFCSKFTSGYEDKVFAVFDSIPAQLSKKDKKYNITSLSKKARFRSYEETFIWLSEAMIVHSCFNASDPIIGLALSRKNHIEIDFLISHQNKICPIEVKSNNYTSHASLDKFKNKFGPRIGTSYILYGKDILIKNDIVHLPFYMAMFL